MKLPTRKSLVWLIPAFLVMLAANVEVMLNRDWEESLYPSNYATINYPTDRPTLRKWKKLDGALMVPDLAWNGKPEGWQLLVDDKPVSTMPGDRPAVTLAAPPLEVLTNTEKDFHKYTLRPLPAGSGLDMSFSIMAVSAELYRRGGLSAATDTYIVHTDVPVGEYKRFPVSYWADDYSYVAPEKLAAADRLVHGKMGIADSDDTITRMDKVFRFLKTVGVASAGVPRDDYRWMDPYSIFEEISAGTGHGWCTQNAQIFVFFANRAGVPTRFVFGCNSQDKRLVYSGHSWAECYVKEKGCWTYVDITMAILGVFDKKGAPLNSADIYQMCQHDTFDGVTANVFLDWDWKKLGLSAPPFTATRVPFTLVNRMAKEEFNTEAIIKYRHPPNVEDQREIYSMMLKDRTYAWTNIKRYLYDPPLAYSNLQTDGERVYCRRQTLFGLLVLSLLLVIVAAFRKPARTAA
jgi:Transglutaminase-like superfamily